MAAIKCPDCRGSVSEKSHACPHCSARLRRGGGGFRDGVAFFLGTLFWTWSGLCLLWMGWTIASEAAAGLQNTSVVGLLAVLGIQAAALLVGCAWLFMAILITRGR